MGLIKFSMFLLSFLSILIIEIQGQDPLCPPRSGSPLQSFGPCSTCAATTCIIGTTCCSDGCRTQCLRFLPTPAPNPRCPPLPPNSGDIRCVTVDVCNIPCRQDQLCCPSPCGQRCTDVPQDPRCPALRGSDLPTTGGRCPSCFRGNRCPPNQICCRAGCGSICIPIPTPPSTPNPACPKVPTGIACFAPVFCPRRCPPGLTCCPHPCGMSCVDTAQDPRCPSAFDGITTTSLIPSSCLTCATVFCSPGTVCCNTGCSPSCIQIPEPTVDPRCPLVRPSGGPCLAQEQCSRRCPPRQICCPSFCGTACIPLPSDPTCPARPTGPVCVAPVSCPPRCPPGLTCCPHPCGTTCIDTSQDPRCPSAFDGITTTSLIPSSCLTCATVFCSPGTVCCNTGCSPSCIQIPEPTVDPRCPLVRPSGGPCFAQEQCPRRCPPRQICCPSFCGTACIPLPPDPTCPARPTGPVCVAPVSCPRRCPPGLTCCPHPCGTSCIDTSQDRRCPASDGISTNAALFGSCGTCRTVRCRRGTICCNPGCRPSCIPIPRPPALCPPLPRGEVRARCNNGRRLGSVCRLSCPPGRILPDGVSRRVTCQPDGTWDQNLENARCIRRPPPRMCPPLVDLSSRPTILFSCDRGRNVGSRCTIYCQPPQTLLGLVPSVRCLPSGNWDQSLENSRCVPASNVCPRVPPGSVGVCTICEPGLCGRGRICCPNGCGSSCIDIPTPSCPRPYTNPRSRVTLDCSDDYNIGSTCRVVCPSGYGVRGIRQTTCRNNRRWQPRLGNTRCVRVCRLGVLVNNCPVAPCRNPEAQCLPYPEARCVNDYCGGCYFYFELNNNQKLSTEQCRRTTLFNRLPGS